jgi:hypothetical protein
VIVAAVGQHDVWAPPGLAALAPYGWHGLE